MAQPIRSKRTLAQMKEVLKEHGEKYYVMFMMGINSGLRISDILRLRVKDVRNRKEISICEKKTGKYKRFWITKPLQNCLEKYIADNAMGDDEYLIWSRKGGNRPITRVQAYRVLHEAADELGIPDIGTHTMRKTFGYWHYRQFHNLQILTVIFNHSSEAVTRRYIGITQDEINLSYKRFGL